MKFSKMPTVFVSYRRSDTSYETTAIAGKLMEHFGKENVLVDVDSIPAGQDFRHVIRHLLKKCDVAVIVIGDTWISDSKGGERRIDDPTDFVRLEVEGVLQKGIPVIPLLVGGSEMPSPALLPKSIAKLSFRNGIQIRPGRDFSRDIETLIGEIHRTIEYQKDILGDKPTRGPASSSTQKTVEKKARKERSTEDRNPAPKTALPIRPLPVQPSWFLLAYFCTAIIVILSAYIIFVTCITILL